MDDTTRHSWLQLWERYSPYWSRYSHGIRQYSMYEERYSPYWSRYSHGIRQYSMYEERYSPYWSRYSHGIRQYSRNMSLGGKLNEKKRKLPESDRIREVYIVRGKREFAGMSVKPMEVFPDLHHKMSKKIAQLTKVSSLDSMWRYSSSWNFCLGYLPSQYKKWRPPGRCWCNAKQSPSWNSADIKRCCFSY